MKYYSQFKQDYIIDHLLKKKENGVFLDLGAHDGVTISNTYFFEMERNWSGICVEPIPEVFEKLKKNRACKLIQGVVAPSDGEFEFKRLHGYTEMLSGIVEFRDDRHDQRTNYEIRLHGGDTEIIKVKGFKVSTILEKYRIRRVDYLSLDIEGGELEVLETMDFKKYDITCLTVENNYGDDAIKRVLKSKGYRLLFNFRTEDFYIKKGSINYFSLLTSREILRIWIKFFKKGLALKLHGGHRGH